METLKEKEAHGGTNQSGSGNGPAEVMVSTARTHF